MQALRPARRRRALLALRLFGRRDAALLIETRLAQHLPIRAGLERHVRGCPALRAHRWVDTTLPAARSNLAPCAHRLRLGVPECRGSILIHPPGRIAYRPRRSRPSPHRHRHLARHRAAVLVRIARRKTSRRTVVAPPTPCSATLLAPLGRHRKRSLLVERRLGSCEHERLAAVLADNLNILCGFRHCFLKWQERRARSRTWMVRLRGPLYSTGPLMRYVRPREHVTGPADPTVARHRPTSSSYAFVPCLPPIRSCPLDPVAIRTISASLHTARSTTKAVGVRSGFALR